MTGNQISVPELPHDVEAERAVLGSVFIKPAALHEVADLETDDFLLPAHREIWDAIRVVEKRGGAWGDPIAVADEMRAHDMLKRLDGGMLYLTDLGNAVPTAENVRHYADIVRGKATQRRVIAVAAETLSAARGDWTNLTELLSETRSKFAAIELRGGSATRWIGDDYDHVLERMEARGVAIAKKGGHVVTTGLTKLDAMIGALREDNLIAIGANPGHGKSALAWDIAINNAKLDIPVLVFSMEMGRAQLIERGIAYEEHINGRNVSAGRMSQAEWYRAQSSRLARLPIWINDQRMTVERLKGEVRSWRSKRRRERLAKGMPKEDAELALVVVDYLQLIDVDSGDSRKRYEAVGAVSRELKLLSKERDANLPIIECVQLNRQNVKDGKEGKPREPQLSDMRESANIEMDADIVIFPWWDFEIDPFKMNEVWLLVRKQRSGVPGRVKVGWQPAYLRFSDLPEDEDQRLPPEDR